VRAAEVGPHVSAALVAGLGSSNHPIQGNQRHKDKCGDSGEGDGKIMHDAQRLLKAAHTQISPLHCFANPASHQRRAARAMEDIAMKGGVGRHGKLTP
jgi:hypothetical protein